MLGPNALDIDIDINAFMMMMRDQKNTHQKKPVRLLVESFAKTGSGQTQLVAAEKVCRDIHTARGGGGALVQFLVFGVCVSPSDESVQSLIVDGRPVFGFVPLTEQRASHSAQLFSP